MSGGGDPVVVSLTDRLAQAGQIVDSAVGGEKCRRGQDVANLRSVAFWGICDIKYDPRLPKQDRVKVLELGDGKSSRFSHHGRPIKEKFDRDYCMDKTPPPINRAVLVENKKFTHDMFVKENFEHLRPATASFPRHYEPGLARKILSRLAVSQDGAVVLKLCNRSRGAGIVVVPGIESELDEMLKRLLQPPPDLLDWLPELIRKIKSGEPEDIKLEQCLHWWSNECPVFVIEKMCNSIPVAKQPGCSELFDGTMRVAFALHRKQAVNKLSHMAVAPEAIKPFDIDWLGGYWKLPKAATVAEDGSVAAGLHDQMVSSFNSVDKRTAEVPQEHLDEVYEALTPALPVIFHTGALGVQSILSLYKPDPLFCAFALARVAATMRTKDMPKARGLYAMARAKVTAAIGDPESLAKRSVLSYVDRNEGVCDAMEGRWQEAGEKWGHSLMRLPSNATTHHLFGVQLLENGYVGHAIERFWASIALDPDFKAPYLALGNCHLHLRQADDAIAAAAFCLRRNPDAPQAQFIMGQAIYIMMFSPARPKGSQAEELRRKAVAALEIARDRVPNAWTAADDDMLQYLSTDEAGRRGRSQLPVHAWKVTAWRP